MLVLGLPGAGCSPKIFGALRCDNASVYGVDWATQPRPSTPQAAASRLVGALAARKGPTVLAGHSAGSVISLLAVLAAPQLVHGLVLASSGAQARGHGDPELPKRIAGGWDAAAREAFLAGCFLRRPPEPLWSELLAYLARLDREALLETVTGVREVDLTHRIAGIACPAVVVHGARDERRPLHFAEELAAGIPGAELSVVPAGHTPMVDCPAEYRDAVERLLRRARPASNNPGERRSS